MSTPVPDHPEAGRLAAYRVGRPVSTAHGLRLSQELAYLLAHNVQPIYSGVPLAADQNASAKYTIAYRRSPGVQALYVGIELYHAGTDEQGAVDLTLAGATKIAGTGELVVGAGPSLHCPDDGTRLPRVHAAILDVSGVSTASIQSLVLDWFNVSGNGGIYRVHVAEIPLADLAPTEAPTTEAGLAASWATPDQRLVDSTPDEGFGFARLFSQLDLARAGMRRHLQLVMPERSDSDYTLRATTTTIGDFTGSFSEIRTVKLYTRARRLYATSVANAYTLFVRYKAASGGTLRLVTPAGNTDVALSSSAVYTTATAAVSLPCNTTDQDVEIQFHGKTLDVANALYVSTIALIETET